MDDLSLELVRLITTQQDIYNGCEAYHNACVVINYYNKYGYTEHFKMLIGEESLIDQAKDVVRRFITWLKEQLTKLIFYIKRTFRRIAHYIESTCRELNMCDLLSKENPYLKLTVPFDIYQSANLVVMLLREMFPIRIEADEPYPSFIQSMDAVVSETRSIVLNRTKQHITQQEVRQYSYRLSDISGGLQSRADTLVRELDKLKSKLNNTTTMTDVVSHMKQMFDGCNSGKIQLISTDSTIITSSTISLVVQKLTYVPVFVTKLCTIFAEQLHELSRIYNEHDVPIELTIPFDTGMLRRLSTFFEGSFEVRHLVVTNVDPKTWPLAGIRTLLPTYGWCYAGSNRSGAVDLWVNIRLLLSRPLFKTRETEFLKTIVHECCHLYDAQHGLPFETVNPQLDYQQYRNSSSEDRAFAAEQNYPYTDADRVWVRDVLRQVEYLQQS